MTEYSAHCSCGIELKIVVVPDSSPLNHIYCRKCQKLIFPVPDVAFTNIAANVANKRKTGTVALPNNLPADFVIDHYQIIQKIGKGNFGHVYLAKDSLTQNKVALKFLQLDAFTQEESRKITEYFVREAQILVELKHPGIVRMVGCGNFQGNLFIATEYIQGPTLLKLLGNQELSIYHALAIAYRIVAALEYAYNNFKLIHRDIKPANIIFDMQENNNPKLIDFGFAKSLGDHHQSLTATGAILGTPWYMPREQLMSTKQVDHRADIYAVGANLYQMLTGVPPYFNYYPSMGIGGLLRAISKNRLAPLKEVKSGIPDYVQHIVAKAMAASPKARYASFTRMKEDISKAISYCQ